MNWSWRGEMISGMLTRRERALIILLLFLLMIYIYYLLIFNPLQREFNRVKEENRQMLESISAQQQLLQHESRGEGEQIKEQMQDLFQQVPDSPAIPQVMSSVQEMADGSGVDLQRIYYKKLPEDIGINGQDQTGLLSEDIEIQVTGLYQQLRNFIAAIEDKDTRIMVLNSCRIKSPGLSQSTIDQDAESKTGLFNSPCLQANISLKVYYDPVLQGDIGEDVLRIGN